MDKLRVTSVDGKKLTRIDKFRLRYEMYKDDYIKQVETRLTNIYSKAHETKLTQQIDMTNNIFKTIVNKISRVYNFGVTREFSNESIEDIYNTLNIDKIMKESNRYLNALNDIIIQVSYNEKKDLPFLIFRYPHKTRVICDEFGESISVEYFVEKRDSNIEVWAYWNSEEHFYKVYDTDGAYKVEYIEGNEKGINPYKELPFLFMQKGFRDDNFFDLFTGDDLVSVTLDNAVYNTFKNYLIKWQSFKQLIITGDELGEINGQLLDPSSALTASGDNVNVDILDLQSNLTQLEEVLNQSINKVAVNYNISPNQFRMTGQVSSGFALKMENISLDEFTKEQQLDYVEYEKELFRLIGVVSGSDYGDINIEFGKPQYQESESIELENVTTKIDLGLTSPSKYLATKRNISEDEAKELIKENITERNDLYNKFNSSSVTVDIPIGDTTEYSKDKINTDNVDNNQQTEIRKYHIDSGIVTANEVRSQIGLDTVVGGDKFISTIGTLHTSNKVAEPPTKDAIKDNND